MTVFEQIKKMDIRELSNLLCNSMSDCDGCPGRDWCGEGQATGEGMTMWLESEVTE